MESACFEIHFMPLNRLSSITPDLSKYTNVDPVVCDDTDTHFRLNFASF